MHNIVIVQIKNGLGSLPQNIGQMFLTNPLIDRLQRSNHVNSGRLTKLQNEPDFVPILVLLPVNAVEVWDVWVCRVVSQDSVFFVYVVD
jgi:hypothetical protein